MIGAHTLAQEASTRTETDWMWQYFLMKEQYFEMIRVLTKLDILRNEVFMCVCEILCVWFDFVGYNFILPGWHQTQYG